MVVLTCISMPWLLDFFNCLAMVWLLVYLVVQTKKYVLGIYFRPFIQQFLTVRDFQVGLKWFSQELFNNLILAQKADPV